MSTPQSAPEPLDQPAASPVTEQPAKKKGSVGKKVLGILVPIVIIGGLFAYNYFTSVGTSSKVGDCLKGNLDNAESIEKIDCGPGANFKIVGRVEDKTQAEMGADGAICAPFPTAQGAYWEGKSKDGKGNVVCLEDFKG